MAAKLITLDWSETAITVYCIIRREADSFRLNDADGAFATAPADPYVSLTEDSVIKGRYELSESRTVWTDGSYTVAIYKQAGGSPAPASDTVIGTGVMAVSSDAEVTDYALQSRLPAALIGGRMDSDIEAINNVVIVGDGSTTPFNV